MDREELFALAVVRCAQLPRRQFSERGNRVNINPSKDNTLYEYDPLDGDQQ